MVVFESTPPLCVLDPAFRLDSFKVRTLHEEGLRPDGSKLLATCAYANVLSELSVSGQLLGDPLGDGLYEYIVELCKGDPLETLQGMGLGQLFPFLFRVLEEDTASAHPKSSDMESHLNFVTSLNSLVRMSNQLYADADVPTNHKYTAHQIALLYQCINHVRGEARPFKRRIEEHFDDIKSITESSTAPELPLDKREWLKGVTRSLKETVGTFPPQISQHLTPAAAAQRRTKGTGGNSGNGHVAPAAAAVAAAPAKGSYVQQPQQQQQQRR